MRWLWDWNCHALLYQSFPRLSLLFPTRHDRNCTNFAFAESWVVVGGWFEVEDRLLDVGGEIGQVDDLRYGLEVKTTDVVVSSTRPESPASPSSTSSISSETSYRAISMLCSIAP
jgi:hypothetical protein